MSDLRAIAQKIVDGATLQDLNNLEILEATRLFTREMKKRERDAEKDVQIAQYENQIAKIQARIDRLRGE